MSKNQDYSILDQPRVLQHLFHPRPEDSFRPDKENRDDMMIGVEDNVFVGASFHFVEKEAPVILFFHGNGEIVSDYDDFADLYTGIGMNFFVVDYRGYGRSSGQPGVASMMADCHVVFDFVLDYMKNKGFSGPLVVMGRSLGSASALELAAARSDDFNSLIIESGFAFAEPLLNTLGISFQSPGFSEESGFANIDKISSFSKPCLVIHAQYDHIIPFSDGKALYEACPSQDKVLLEIKGANHNDLFMKGMQTYLEHVKQICT